MQNKYTEIKARYIKDQKKEILNIGYFADGEWSYRAFNKLILDKNINIKFICVRYDTQDEILKSFCEQYDIDYLKNKNVNSKEFLDKLKQYNCDLFVSMSFNQIFKKEIINIPKFKTINCHAGKLPFYRGRNILNWVLINDEKEFGITVHYMDSGIDTGDIIMQRSYDINDTYTYKTLLNIAFEECANILYDSVKLLQKFYIEPIKQNSINEVGFYCTQRKIGDEKLNWNQTSREIFNFVRAICKPAPMARTILNSKEMKINKIEMIKKVNNYKNIVGAIIGKDGENIFVKTKDTFIKITEYEYDGVIRIGDRFEL